MNKEEIRELIDSLLSPDADFWSSDLLLKVHSAIISMGTFQEPLEKELEGVTFAEWQQERAKRAALAVLHYLLETSDR